MKSSKVKIRYSCSECGRIHLKWQGSCDGCGSRNTLEEVQESKSSSTRTRGLPSEDISPVLLSEVSHQRVLRSSTAMEEVDLVLGGGLVPGALVLLAGAPGIGKSTLLLQMAKGLCSKENKILYVSGEESASQISLRAERLGLKSGKLYLYCTPHLESALKEAERLKPDVIFFDSIQTLWTSEVESAPGTVGQIREATLRIMEYSKRTSVISIIVGHVTKGGDIAGPKLLEHMVDVVLNFEGDKSHFFRILRGAKNRFGATDEIGIFEMKPEGLSPVLNPSSYFVEECQEVSGSCRSVIMEGSQPFLVEVQALVTDNYFAYPKRTAIGYDPNRLSLLLAVMEKRMGIQFGQLDVCVNLAGGVRSTDPALDLAVIAAIYSSLKNTCISSRALFLGEVGLGGEIRMISRLESRLKEASRQGALHSVCPEIKRAGFKWKKTEMKLCALEHIGKLRDWLSELEKES